MGSYNNNINSYKRNVNYRTVYTQEGCVSYMLEIAKFKIKTLDDSLSGAGSPASERDFVGIISQGRQE